MNAQRSGFVCRGWAQLSVTLVLTACLALRAGDAHAGSAQALSPRVYQQLTEVQGLMEQSNYADAERRLRGMLDEWTQGGYAQAIGLQMLAQAQAARQRYPQAAQSLATSIALEALPEETQQQARYDLAQLYLAAGSPAQAVAVLETWFEQATQPPAGAYFLLGTAYLQDRAYRKAIKPLRRAIETSQSSDETWYQTLLAAHYELSDYAACAEVLEQMLRLFPERDYWQQLSGIYLALHRDEKALSVLELAYRQRRLQREPELMQLVQLYLARDIPIKAARLLEAEMLDQRVADDAANLELLAGAWAQARERSKAIDSYRRALHAGADGRLALIIGELYIEDERWQEAATVLETTLQRHRPGAPADAWLLLGVARYEEGDLAAARAAFEEAARHDNTRTAAEQWLEHLAARL